ncbi:restriction endonuclease [Pseudoalteromonas distincta]|uniref:restriction endonuclease n=1 Tax=Pseudoalteromonas distincta TaxID=77608 RepID=UPI0011F38CF0|nr:hypothetical protein [Pseudoalteromonas distincta]KAA1160927.1 hypothetical protein EU511_08835 [Pseudoalteromonas distincta]
MTFIRNIASRFAYKTISVEIDPLLLSELDTVDKVTTSRDITFNLYNLIYHIGSIQSRRFAPSNRLKFMDKSDLIEKIYSDTDEFRVKINDIRSINGSETLTFISEDFGVGISVVIADKLFNIKRSTIQKIYGTKKRPDWKCQTQNNRILVVEAKGTISIQTSRTQEKTALIQKTKESGDVKVASLTVLNENSVSTNRFLDPPIDNSDISPMMENHILRAGHYASVFSFLGNSKLSKYYSQMRKRLEGSISPYEQVEKDDTFRELRTNDPIINFENKEFVGSFYEVEHEKNIFVGVDKKLLSYSGFIEFCDYENDTDTLVEGNHYILFKDGVLIVEIEKIGMFSDIVMVDKIKNYQSKITVSDIDEMNRISFSKYFISLLERNGFTNIREEAEIGYIPADITAEFNDITYYFELKIYRNKKMRKNVIAKVNNYSRKVLNEKFVLVTNGKLSRENLDNFNLTIIDRDALKEIAKNYRNFMDLLSAE